MTSLPALSKLAYLWMMPETGQLGETQLEGRGEWLWGQEWGRRSREERPESRAVQETACGVPAGIWIWEMRRGDKLCCIILTGHQVFIVINAKLKCGTFVQQATFKTKIVGQFLKNVCACGQRPTWNKRRVLYGCYGEIPSRIPLAHSRVVLKKWITASYQTLLLNLKPLNSNTSVSTWIVTK